MVVSRLVLEQVGDRRRWKIVAERFLQRTVVKWTLRKVRAPNDMKRGPFPRVEVTTNLEPFFFVTDGAEPIAYGPVQAISGREAGRRRSRGLSA